MLIVTRNEQRLLTSELVVFGLIGRHLRPGWPSSVAGVAIIGLVGHLWPEWPSLAAGWPSVAGMAIIGLGGHHWRPVGRLWPRWPSLAWLAICGRGGHHWPGLAETISSTLMVSLSRVGVDWSLLRVTALRAVGWWSRSSDTDPETG